MNPKPNSEQSNWATDTKILPHAKITFSQAVSMEKRGHYFNNESSRPRSLAMVCTNGLRRFGNVPAFI